MSKEIEYLPHSSGCFLCVDENTCGVLARFFVEGDTVRARVSLPIHLNGYKEIAHGGVVAGLLDETMGWAATIFAKKQSSPTFYVTGELTIKYLAPVPVGKEIEIRSRLVKAGGRIAYGEGELFYEDRVYVRAKGKFIPMTHEATREVIPYLKFEHCRKFRTLFDKLMEER